MAEAAPKPKRQRKAEPSRAPSRASVAPEPSAPASPSGSDAGGASPPTLAGRRRASRSRVTTPTAAHGATDASDAADAAADAKGEADASPQRAVRASPRPSRARDAAVVNAAREVGPLHLCTLAPRQPLCTLCTLCTLREAYARRDRASSPEPYPCSYP